jgi:pSer/pThr/pTyr-binding forkhead associated (FHA) protein
VYLFKDPDISPQHAALHQIPGGFELEDLGSATGTRVNGKSVKRRRLRNGDQVQIGSTCFLFQEKARARAAEDGERVSVPALAERAPAPEGSFTP